MESTRRAPRAEPGPRLDGGAAQRVHAREPPLVVCRADRELQQRGLEGVQPGDEGPCSLFALSPQLPAMPMKHSVRPCGNQPS